MDIRKLISDNFPLILTSMGVSGVIATTVLAVKATPEAYREIQDARSETTEPITKVDMVKLTYRHYIPAAAVGISTIAAIVGAQSVNMKRQAALVGLWTVTDKALSEYKNQVIKTIGEKKEKEIVTEVVRERMDKDEFNTEIIVTGRGKQKFKDTISGRYFESDIESVRQAQNNINAQCINEMYASLNDFYREVGLPGTAHGEEAGWRADRLLEIAFIPQLSEDGEACIGLDYRSAPIRSYWKELG